MTSPTEQRRSFDAAMDAYRGGDTARALSIFTDITGAAPTMSDARLGRVGCGGHGRDTWAPAHGTPRALPRDPRRIGLPDGTLHARPAAPQYLTMPAWSRASIGLAYAAALIIAGRYDDAVQVLSDPVITDDAQAAQWHPFITATVYFATQRWPDVREVTAVSAPTHATYAAD